MLNHNTRVIGRWLARASRHVLRSSVLEVCCGRYVSLKSGKAAAVVTVVAAAEATATPAAGATNSSSSSSGSASSRKKWHTALEFFPDCGVFEVSKMVEQQERQWQHTYTLAEKGGDVHTTQEQSRRHSQESSGRKSNTPKELHTRGN